MPPKRFNLEGAPREGCSARSLRASLRAAFPLLLLVAPGFASGDVADRLAELVQRARAAEGLGPLSRRSALDRAAESRARELASRDDAGVMGPRLPLAQLLRDAGSPPFRDAAEHVVLSSGHRDPAAHAFRALERKKGARASFFGSGFDGIGAAEGVTPSGSRLFVLVAVDDLPNEEDRAPMADRLVERTNELRREAGLAPLTRVPDLDEVARRHSEDMARRGYFAHVDPDGRGLAARAAAGGLLFSSLRENLFVLEGRGSVADLAAGHWMGSRGHRENLLAPEITETGVGIAAAPEGRLYVTQLYARPPDEVESPGSSEPREE